MVEVDANAKDTLDIPKNDLEKSDSEVSDDDGG
jgi:hypothetical protein